MGWWSRALLLLAAGQAAAYRAHGQRAGTRVPRSRLVRARPAPAVRMAGSRATVTKELVVPVPAHHLYGLLANYSRYQEIWPGEYQSVHVLDQSKKAGRKDTTTVEFTHTPVMGLGMKYALDVEGVKDKSVLWTLNSSNLIEYNKGGWRLTDLGDGSTKVTYGCEVQLRANVPTFVTNFVLSQAFPKMLKTFSKSAALEWEQVQAEQRERFRRPLQAAAGSVNATLKSLEQAAEATGGAAKALATSTVSEVSARVDGALSAIRTAMKGTRAAYEGLGPGSEGAASRGEPDVKDEVLRLMLERADEMLLNASGALRLLENATVLEISSRCDAAVAALDEFAQYAAGSAEEMADRTSSTLADMSSGRYGINRTSVDTVDFSARADAGAAMEVAAVAKPAPALQRAVASGYSAVANGVLGVLEAIVPGDRSGPPPASKRQRLGNLLGRGGGARPAAAAEPGALPTALRAPDKAAEKAPPPKPPGAE